MCKLLCHFASLKRVFSAFYFILLSVNDNLRTLSLTLKLEFRPHLQRPGCDFRPILVYDESDGEQ
jgi:hypothetical protein